MKVLVIPDVHGNWEAALKNIAEHKDEVEKVVVLGDYVDDFDESLNGKPMVDGFNKLMEYKRAEPEKFEVLFGNHCASYLPQSRHAEGVSGHHPEFAKDYLEMFSKNIDLINICCVVDGVLFSHAGVSRNFLDHATLAANVEHKFDKVPLEIFEQYNACNEALRDINKNYFGGEVFSLVNAETPEDQAKIDRYHEIQTEIHKEMNEVYEEMLKYDWNMFKYSSIKNLNKIFHSNHGPYNYNTLIFEHCGWDGAGDSSGESCTWIRPNALLLDPWPVRIKYQVVGHTELGEKYFTYKGKHLMVLDSHEHNLYKIIDTEKMDELPWEELHAEVAPSFTAEEIKLLQMMGLI